MLFLLECIFIKITRFRLTKLFESQKSKTDILVKHNEELTKIINDQEVSRPKIAELQKTCADMENDIRKVSEENKIMKAKEEKLKIEKAAKDNRIQEYKTRFDEAKTDYNKVKEIVEKQQYTKAGIQKIISETISLEETIKKVNSLIKDEERKIAEKKQQKRELEEQTQKILRKVNASFIKIYGENAGVALKFDTEKNVFNQMIVTGNGSPLEALDEMQVQTLKNRKEEICKNEQILGQLREEAKIKNKENDDSQKVNEIVRQEIEKTKKKLSEIIQTENENEGAFKKELDKNEESLRKVEKNVEELNKEIYNLEEENKKKKQFLEALNEQIKKDREETKNHVKDFTNEILQYKMEIGDEFDQLVTAIHNTNIQLQKADIDDKEIVA